LGDPDHYVPLANLLTVGMPMYGLHVLDQTPGALREMTMQHLAAHHIEAMLRIQKNGPYVLVGHSSGGLLAYEMASQLLSSGEKIGFIGLIDTFDLRNEISPSVCGPEFEQEFLIGYIKRTINQFNLGLASKKEAFDGINSMIFTDATLFFNAAKEHELLPEGFNFEEARDRVPYAAALVTMAYAYVPPIIEAAVHQFAATASMRDSPRLKWKEEATGRWVVHAIRGDHQNIMHHPSIQDLANEMSIELMKLTDSERA
jgi:syringomycin synthetase protein SyrE